MTLWRWLGSLVCLAAFMVLVGGNLTSAQDKDKKADPDKDKKVEPVKDKKADPEKDKKPDPDKDKKVEPVKDKKADPDKDKKVDPVKDKKVEPEPKSEAGKEKLAWKAFDPKSKFYQELTTNTKQVMTVMGQEITQNQKQTFYLMWTAEEKTKDGNYVVTQKIIGLKMDINIGGNTIAYDSTAKNQDKNPMSDFFKALLSLDLKLIISPKMEVINVEGQEEFIKKLGGANPQMEPLLKNILSKDALQHMAEPTWGALPASAVVKGDTWSNKAKPSVLDLGPIGKYTTTFTYTYDGPDEKKLDKINIKSELKYSKPEVKNGLPFTIKDATLSSKEGSGVALFDREKGRFTKTTMKMELVGDLTIEVGGMETKVALTQTQDAESKMTDTEPAGLSSTEKKQ